MGNYVSRNIYKIKVILYKTWNCMSFLILKQIMYILFVTYHTSLFYTPPQFWNTSLQERANTWAHRCKFRPQGNIDVGENIFYLPTRRSSVSRRHSNESRRLSNASRRHGNGRHRSTVTRAIHAWRDERERWSNQSASCFDACQYTQV